MWVCFNRHVIHVTNNFGGHWHRRRAESSYSMQHSSWHKYGSDWVFEQSLLSKVPQQPLNNQPGVFKTASLGISWHHYMWTCEPSNNPTEKVDIPPRFPSTFGNLWNSQMYTDPTSSPLKPICEKCCIRTNGQAKMLKEPGSIYTSTKSAAELHS